MVRKMVAEEQSADSPAVVHTPGFGVKHPAPCQANVSSTKLKHLSSGIKTKLNSKGG